MVVGSLILLAALIVVSISAVWLVPEPIPFGVVVKSIWSHLTGHSTSTAIQDTIVWQIRLPRVLLAIIVGMLLSTAGAALQGLLHNPLADPYIVGVSSGAALGASVAIVFGLSGILYSFGIPLVAFVFAMAAMLVVYSLARYSGRVSIQSFLLAGVVVGSFLWALLTFVLTLAGRDVATIIRWLLGSLDSPNPWAYVVMTLPFALIGIVVLLAMARDLNIFSLGEETARHMGIETENLKLIIILTTSFITAAAVSASGIIGFVGLMMPHVSRRVFGSDHRVLIPTAALLGAILLVLADAAARALGEMPIGVITAILGAPFFLYLLRKQPR